MTKILGDFDSWVCDEDIRNGVGLHFKGHGLKDEDIIRVIVDRFFDDDNQEAFILGKEERRYYTTRYIDGSDAKEQGHNCWIVFVDEEDAKKTYGKCTWVEFRISNYGVEDE